MNLFLDTEYNEFKGSLISLALVPESVAIPSFYQSLGCEDPKPWVADNVMPFLNIKPISKDSFQMKLGYYLNNFFNEVTIISDWHEDIIHFCDMLTTGPGTRILTPTLKFEIRRDLIKVESKIPHNALSDATALRDSAKLNVLR